MNYLNECIDNIYKIIIGEIPTDDETLIKMHTRYLEKLGDISFPMPLKNWYHLVEKTTRDKGLETIFNYNLKENDVESALQQIKTKLSNFNAKIKTYTLIKSSVHLFLERPLLFTCGIQKVLTDGNAYGKWVLFSKLVEVTAKETEAIDTVEHMDLSTLRLFILQVVIANLMKLTTNSDSMNIFYVNLFHNNKCDESNVNILCGPVVKSEKGIKDATQRASDFFNKRISDMRLMAQHRYRVNVKSTSEWNQVFGELGKASVTVELLANKPHKSLKVTLDDLSGANKGPSFIFYNCARLSILLQEFDNKVSRGTYPCLPSLDDIDFTLLRQPEEWELLYVYILQFPFVIKNCVRSVEKGIVNPQHLITFLANLSSIFSVYYRRVRILTDARDHMFGVIYARIYLLKALQIVFHNALRILNIDPIKEM